MNIRTISAYLLTLIAAMLTMGVTAAAADPNNPNPNSGAPFAPGLASSATDGGASDLAPGQPADRVSPSLATELNPPELARATGELVPELTPPQLATRADIPLVPEFAPGLPFAELAVSSAVELTPGQVKNDCTEIDC